VVEVGKINLPLAQYLLPFRFIPVYAHRFVRPHSKSIYFLYHIAAFLPRKRGVAYLGPADNYLVPQTGYNALLSRHCEGDMR
jgi:hypothetical protein